VDVHCRRKYKEQSVSLPRAKHFKGPARTQKIQKNRALEFVLEKYKDRLPVSWDTIMYARL
jgi:hypothetical protein